jgi:hypothetical protein
VDIGNNVFIGVLLLIVLLGVFLWFDRSRTLECRTTAQNNGASIVDAVNLCKK